MANILSLFSQDMHITENDIMNNLKWKQDFLYNIDDIDNSIKSKKL